MGWSGLGHSLYQGWAWLKVASWPVEVELTKKYLITGKGGLKTGSIMQEEVETSDYDAVAGLFGQPNLKKPKRQLLDNSLDNLTPMSGSIPSPAASQMSNMSNPNKFIKMLGGRERGRKSKGSKMPAAQPGSGSAWSLFEDQALVVLVHDMGPNWELVSDAINSTLQFKCIFHKPKECKERHKYLMDKTAGDGADSAEDSGSSQPYPSTLPGIPKGSARQLFQRLQGPMEEDTLKSHFEKIVMIGQKQQYRRLQNDIHDAKQLQQSHVSHPHALSQVCPNNLSGGGPVLTPLDLCDTPGSSPEALGLGYQSPHSSGLPISNQGTLAQMLPASGANSPLQGSSSVVLGSNVSSPSGSLQTSARYGIPRTASLSIDEQQRLQQYNQMISGRNIQQPSSPVPGAVPGTDRGVRMLAGGNGMGVMGGMTRSMPMSRPGFQGIASSSMLNSGSMLSSGMVAMTSPVNMHTGPGHGQGNSMLRPRDALHLMRPEHQRQMIAPELQMQVSQGNSQGVSPFGGLSPSFSNQTASPPYPLHHQQSHPMSPQQSHALNTSHHQHLQGPNHATNSHQAYAIRFAKERHLQQRILQQQQQQQQFSPSNPLMPHVQQQSQLPISSPPSQSSSSAVSLSSSSMTPILQHPQKHHMPPHGLGRNPQSGGSALPNQMGKQRRQPQQQQFQQAGRHHPQQRQQTQGQQQAKVSKGVGRGNMMTHPNLPIDPTLLNGLPATPGNQSTEKGEQAPHLGQGLYSGSGLNSVLSSKQSVPPHSSNHSQPQQKIYSTQAPPSSKKLQQIPSHSDTANQNHVQPVASAPTLSTSHQTVPPSIMASSNQTHLKVANQTQPNAQRVLQPNCQVNSHPQNKLQARESQAEQHTANNSSQVGITAATPQTCIDSTNVVPVVSSASAPPWKVSDPSYDSGMPNHAMHLGSTGNLPLTSSTGSESPAPASQGPGQRQFVGHDGGVQWQPSQLQPPAPLSTPQQLQQQSPQQQTRLHGGPNSSHLRPTNTKPE
ncbi:hypothetical protein RJ639_046366 [Escallonia herrerae]|uniref:Myb-like domain-containing protein n=1 Tax=Escallonia herrerae TaxID=1293975 RepID=A0AA88W6C2_9ASTE|nr:hypothetical protein RJ639_046366 [Escallonia herrerae]